MENRLAVSLHIFLALLLLSGGMAFRMMKGSGRMGAFPLLKLAAGDGLDASALNADELRKVANEGGYADGEKFVRLFHPAFPTKVLESLSISLRPIIYRNKCRMKDWRARSECPMRP